MSVQACVWFLVCVLYSYGHIFFTFFVAVPRTSRAYSSKDELSRARRASILHRSRARACCGRAAREDAGARDWLVGARVFLGLEWQGCDTWNSQSSSFHVLKPKIAPQNHRYTTSGLVRAPVDQSRLVRALRGHTSPSHVGIRCREPGQGPWHTDMGESVGGVHERQAIPCP